MLFCLACACAAAARFALLFVVGMNMIHTRVRYPVLICALKSQAARMTPDEDAVEWRAVEAGCGKWSKERRSSERLALVNVMVNVMGNVMDGITKVRTSSTTRSSCACSRQIWVLSPGGFVLCVQSHSARHVHVHVNSFERMKTSS